MDTHIEVLNKKLSDLRDELEDSLETIEDEKRKNKKIKDEKEDLEFELEKQQKQCARIQENCEKIQEKFSDLQILFDKSQDALNFVTEVLSAKLVDDTDVVQRHKDIDAIVDFVRGDVRDSLKEAGVLSVETEKNFFCSNLDSWASTMKKVWIQGKKTIAFVGEFSAGKTSIVNRILSQDNPDIPLLPVSMKATTAIPTYISGGVATYYRFVTPDNELKVISPSTFMRVSKEVLDKVKGVSSLIQYFVMTYKNPCLDNMSILDTPGFSSYDQQDEKRTIDVINECDALFWVLDVNAGSVNTTSLKVIKKYLTKPLYIILNKIDTKARNEIKAVEASIRETFEKEGVKIEDVVHFSCKEPLEVILKTINRVSRNDNRENFLDNLIEIIESFSKEIALKTKVAFDKSNICQERHSQAMSDFRKELENLNRDCNQLSYIPQFNSKIWGKDDYRMTKPQYERFSNLIDQITYYRKENLNRLFNKQMEMVVELESSWNTYSVNKRHQIDLQKCLDTLKQKRQKYVNKKPINSNLMNNEKGKNIRNSVSTETKSPKLKMKDFEDIFRWDIVEELNEGLRMNWDSIRSTLNYLTGSSLTKKRLKELIPKFGNKRPVDKQELFEQVDYILRNIKNER